MDGALGRYTCCVIHKLSSAARFGRASADSAANDPRESTESSPGHFADMPSDGARRRSGAESRIGSSYAARQYGSQELVGDDGLTAPSVGSSISDVVGRRREAGLLVLRYRRVTRRLNATAIDRPMQYHLRRALSAMTNDYLLMRFGRSDMLTTRLRLCIWDLQPAATGSRQAKACRSNCCSPVVRDYVHDWLSSFGGRRYV